MINLIKRLKTLTGPDREVDAEIAKAIGWESGPWEIAGMRGVTWYASGPEVHKECPRFTSSIDAARAICPDAMMVYASDVDIATVHLVTDTSTTPIIGHVGIGATLEIAWCIAALKAREAINEN